MIKPDFDKFTNKQKCLFGAMLGDALGVPFEFKRPHKINSQYIKIPCAIPDDYKTYRDAPLGVYSDDFSQTLCVEECIKNSDRDFPTEMQAWRYGKYWVNKKLFDCGSQTSIALDHHYRTGRILYDEEASGNGGIMRLAPVAFCSDTLAAHYYSSLTHNSEEAINASEFYVSLLDAIAECNVKFTFDQAWHCIQDEMEWAIPHSQKGALGSGYVIDTLNSIRHCINASTSYSEAVTTAIKLGNDTDTTATCVGAVAALYFGIDDISDEWMEYIQPSLQNPYVKTLFDLE